MKFSRLILAVISCLALPLRAELADGVKAIVNDTAITFAQVEDFAAPEIDSLRRQYADQPDVFQQKLTGAMNDALEQLVDRQLILRDFDVEGYKLPDSAVDEMVQARIRDQFDGDRVTFMKTLQARNETFEKFRDDIRDQYIIYQLRMKKVSQSIVISPYKVENYYQTHQDDFKLEDQVKLRMIVINKISTDDTNSLRMAGEILSQLKAGASFDQMASIYSQGSQRNQSGEWGWVERSVLRKELSDVAFTLKPGQISDVIETPEACYIMLVEQTWTAHVKALSDVRDDIEKTLGAQQQSQLEKQWIDSLKKKTFIRYFD
jgi:peptidyl-prolyl cis-trans isomerase SurA